MKITKMLLAFLLLFTVMTNNIQIEANAASSVTIGTATTVSGAVDEAMKGVDSTWSNLEKVLYLHDYLVTHTEYDYENYEKNTVPSVDYTAKGALVNKLAVCQGYAEAFKLLMEEIGVPVKIVTSASMDHAWNIIKLDGYWYHVDCTWDDLGGIDGVRHLNFLRSDSGIRNANHYGWSSSYKCSSTKYDNMFWKSVSTPIYESNDSWYYEKDDVIYKMSSLTGKSTKVIGLQYISSFAIDDKYIFFTSLDTVKRMNKDGSNIVTLLSFDGDVKQISGVRYVNGKRYYGYYDKINNQSCYQYLDIDKKLPDVGFNIYSTDMYLRTGEYDCLTLGDYFTFDKDYYISYYFTIEDTSVAILDGDFVEAVSEGETTVTLHTENNKKLKFKIHVTDSVISFSEWTPLVVFVGTNESLSFDFSSYNNQYSWEDVTYTSSNPSIGYYSEYYLQTFKPGEFTITVSLPNGVSDTKRFIAIDEKGWQKIEGNKYYFDEYGRRAEMNCEIDGNQYYFAPNGILNDDGWFKDMYYYKFDLYAYEDGKLAIGWNGIDGKIYYFNEETGYLEKEVKDVVSGKWYYDTVVETYERGLMTGTTDTTFEPNSPMTRGMVVTVLHRIASKPQVSFTGRFSDVWSKKYCAMAVEWAAKYKVVSGYKDGTFGADDNITRQDVAVILHNYAKTIGLDLTKTKDLSTFKDHKNVSSYSKSALEWACANGILSGTKDGKLNPKGNATRAECAKMLLQFSKLVESK